MNSNLNDFVFSNADKGCKFESKDKAGLDQHVCHFTPYSCPMVNCGKKLALHEFVSHLKKGHKANAVDRIKDGKVTASFAAALQQKSVSYPPKLFAWNGVDYAILMEKKNETYYIRVLAIARESDTK